ncbi:MAG: hypothetical protein DSY33_04850 [Archaeoglobus sp.]|nr:MAG: hypothetical protein DSY33_04850 [Archaeoglobus sp.]
MKLEDWLYLFYFPIVSEFGYSVAEDASSAKTLADVAKLEKYEVLRIFEGKKVFVVGNAPGRGIEIENDDIDDRIVVTAGKTIITYDHKIDVHVTDLDEGFKEVCKAADIAKILIVHAHGDNEELVREYTPSLGKIVGTTQFLPFERVYNFGGFTDGDRAALIANSFGGQVELVNFRFDTAESYLKLMKMKWAKKILEFEGILTHRRYPG